MTARSSHTLHKGAVALQRWLHGLARATAAAPATAPARAPVHALEMLRLKAMESLRDCSGASCERMRWKLQCAASAREIWLQRGEMFQLIACQLCQSEAAARIEALDPLLADSLPVPL